VSRFYRKLKGRQLLELRGLDATLILKLVLIRERESGLDSACLLQNFLSQSYTHRIKVCVSLNVGHMLTNEATDAV
jgi:hypothetical protein